VPTPNLSRPRVRGPERPAPPQSPHRSLRPYATVFFRRRGRTTRGREHRPTRCVGVVSVPFSRWRWRRRWTSRERYQRCRRGERLRRAAQWSGRALAPAGLAGGAPRRPAGGPYPSNVALDRPPRRRRRSSPTSRDARTHPHDHQAPPRLARGPKPSGRAAGAPARGAAPPPGGGGLRGHQVGPSPRR
jgi:hypothetical protein